MSKSDHKRRVDLERIVNKSRATTTEAGPAPTEGYPIFDYRNGREVEVGWVRWPSGQRVYYQTRAEALAKGATPEIQAPTDGWSDNPKRCRAVHTTVSRSQCILDAGHEDRHSTRFLDEFDGEGAEIQVAPVLALRGSLELFTAHYEPWMDEWSDDHKCHVHSSHTFGQLRAARAALAATSAGVPVPHAFVEHAWGDAPHCSRCGRPEKDALHVPAPAAPMAPADEWFRDCIGQALATYMTENASDNSFTIDPFNSHEIDGIADVVLRAALTAARHTSRRLRGPFRVSVSRMDTSGGSTFFVCLDRPDRPNDAAPWAPGRITPFSTPNRADADTEAARWREFLGAAD